MNWERLFNKKDIEEQVAVVNETILNVFRNYMPNKYITIDDKDLLWMNENIKLKIKAKTICTINTFKTEKKNWKWLLLLGTLITELNELINTTKALYYQNLNKKLNNPLLQANTHWSILKTFYIEKKIH